jgi:uncharacterized protein (DUF4415 family)
MEASPRHQVHGNSLNSARLCNSRERCGAALAPDRCNKLFAVLKNNSQNIGQAIRSRLSMPDGYQQHARPFVSSAQPDRVTVTLDMDADLLDWLQENPLWPREIHDMLRAYMEINLIRETAFEEAAADQQQGEF